MHISVKIDLITGFLGSGKTTFLLRYASFLMKQGLRIGILVYDHGAVNVDLPLLNSLRGDRCEIETVAGACDPDCHRRRFRTKLITMAMSGYDRVVIEPSGIFDMDEFYDTLQEPPLDKQFEIGSVITVVEATLEENFSKEEDFFLGSQAACAGKILLSKVQLADEHEIAGTLMHLRRAETDIGCSPADDGKIIIKDWDQLTDEDFSTLMQCGYRMPDYEKTIAGSDVGFQSLSFLDLPLNGDMLMEKVKTLFRDARYGRILRVKGFYCEGTQWYQLNATAGGIHMEKTATTRGAIIVIGSSLNENEISILLTGKTPEHRIL